jgi:hypothetical protein
MAGGCSSSSGMVDGPIDFSVSGGFTGGGDGTALHIELDGTATRSTESGGSQTATLDAATLDDLDRKIVDAQFPSLAPVYSCNCADSFIYNVSVQLDGSTHTIAADSLAALPDRLDAVIDTLQDIYQRPLDWQ